LLATVKGDVHDIGKNIVGVVLACNNFDIVDLGVMVPTNMILDKANEINADVIGLSGLITPSLDEMVGVATEMEKRGMKTPLIVGGATTSRIHTAVKIDPTYSAPVIHINDASRSVAICSELLSDKSNQLTEKVKLEYENLRIDHSNRREKKVYLSFDDAKKNKYQIDRETQTPAKPKKIGVEILENVDLNELRKFIDWSPFFKTWMLTGKYPAILKDETVGTHANELFNDANRMLDDIIKGKKLTAKAVFGLFPAYSFREDVSIFEDESKNKHITTFHFLRQQVQKRSNQPNVCLSDFIAPKDSGMDDYLGLFAVTAGLGIETMLQEFKADHDDYSSIMVKAIADRLAEAHAEYLHYKIRTEFWGYSNEQFDNDAFIAKKYNGIRPAPGYPACPDHTEKKTLFRVLDVKNNIGISLTESCAMYPASSVSGFYFSNPNCRYFNVGKLKKDQMEEYSKRKCQSIEETEKWLAPNLAYIK
jgi:5-methyltetrahydrofolate--homocysteine methyltransferase